MTTTITVLSIVGGLVVYFIGTMWCAVHWLKRAVAIFGPWQRAMDELDFQRRYTIEELDFQHVERYAKESEQLLNDYDKWCRRWAPWFLTDYPEEER